MHHLAAKGLVTAAMDNSDGLLPTLTELTNKNTLGIDIDVNLLTVPGLTEAERQDQARLWLGWGDWNVIACVSPNHEEEVINIARELSAVVVHIGRTTSRHSDVVLRRGDAAILAPRLESERFAKDSWMLKGIDEYVRMLRSVTLPH
jgi:thiamine monophosphate kinase